MFFCIFVFLLVFVYCDAPKRMPTNSVLSFAVTKKNSNSNVVQAKEEKDHPHC